MAMSGVLTVLLFCLIICTQAMEQQPPIGRRSKRDTMVSSMFSFFSSMDKRLAAMESRFDNITEEQLARLEIKMEEELKDEKQYVKEKLEDVEEKQQIMEERLQAVQDGMQRLESMVLELLSTRLESMVTEILTSKLTATEQKMTELEDKTNATEERLVSLEASNTETQTSPASCKYQYLYQFEKEAPRSSADLQRVTKLETELTRLQEKVSALDKHQQDNDLSVHNLVNASLVAMEDAVHSMTRLVAASEQNLQYIMENATENLASMMNDSDVRLLTRAESNTAALNASTARVEQMTQELATRMSAVEDKVHSVKERMAASEEVKSTLQNATAILTSMMTDTKIQLLAWSENNTAELSTSMARVEQTTKELATHVSAVEDKLDNASSHQAEEMQSTKAMLKDMKKTTEELSAPLHYRRTCQAYYDDGHRTSGVYTLQLHYGGNHMEVYCEMSNGAGWVVFQRRQDGSVDFYRNWTSYEDGFGDLTGEFWLGNRNIHRLTSAGLTQLRVDLQAWNGSTAFASYSHFSVGDASSSYKLSVSGYSGTAGDSLAYHNSQKFSTLDQDNDVLSSLHCARDYNKGAWWYGGCTHANLNGEYGTRGSSGEQYVVWYHWLDIQSLQRTELKLK